MKISRSQLKKLITESLFEQYKRPKRIQAYDECPGNLEHNNVASQLEREISKMSLPVELVRHCGPYRIAGFHLDTALDRIHELTGNSSLGEESIVGVIRFTDSYSSKQESGYRSLHGLLSDKILPSLGLTNKVYIDKLEDYQTRGAGHGGVGPGYGLLVVHPV